MATFNPNRIGPGTFELVRDSTTGNYTIKEVGFTKISPLNLPDLDTTAATTTATQTQTATDVTGDTVSQQTKMAFNMPDRGGDNQPDTTGSMLQEARQTSDMLSDTFTRPNMRDIAGDRITSPLDIQSPTERVFDRPNMRDVAGDVQQDKPALELDEPTVRTDSKGLSARGTIDRRPQTEFTRPNMRDVAGDATPMTQQEIPDRNIGQLGVDTSRFEGVSQMGALAGDEKDDVKPVKRNALETVSTSLKSAFKNIKTPTMMVLDAITPDPTAVNKHDTSYFTDRGDGRIGGNPATDLYAGMNRVSAFGNLEKAGAKRIDTRRATIARKGIKSASNPNGVSQEFVNNTNNMEKELDDMRRHNNNENIKSAKKKGVDTSKLNPNEMRNVAETGDPGGNGGGGKSIVCTAMYQTTGLQDWAKAMKIWYIYQKRYLTIQHQEGYHKLFKPFVKGMHKSNIIKAIGAHFAKHRTQHLKHVMFNSKPSLLGKIYNKVFGYNN